ncbi:MAG: hypothetical protein RMK29_04430 [Myxococcales bacterium]|nr:galactose oxidase [Myxococcota bacterium]MDW8280935.1 hypothetical protein [Myxococcales bacterium]
MAIVQRWPTCSAVLLVLMLGACVQPTPEPDPDPEPAADLATPGDLSAPPDLSGRVSGWSSGPRLLLERSEIAAAVLGTRIFVGGGFVNGTGTAPYSFEELDAANLQTARWVRRADIPMATLDHLGLAALGGKIYLSRDRNFFVYDPATDRWTRGKDLPLRRSAHVMVAARGRLYVIGGVGDEPLVPLEYDPASETWTRRAPMSTEREHLAAAVYRDLIYVIGGRWAGRGNTNLVEEYDPATDRWRTRRPMPTARGGLTAATVGDRIHVTGGEAFNPNRVFPEHEIYNPSEDSWVTGPPLPTGRHGLASAGVDGRFFVIGGGRIAGLSFSDLTDIYTP